MSERGDCRRLKRQRYHQWLRRRWEHRAKQAAARRLRDGAETCSTPPTVKGMP